MLDGTIEMDETYIGGRNRGAGRGRGARANKEVVIGIRQRSGDLRSSMPKMPARELLHGSSKKTSATMLK